MNDCLIIGGGPAGLTAALYLARFRLRCQIFDAGAGRASMIPRTHNFPGFADGISGSDLIARMQKQLERYGVTPISDRVENITYDGSIFQIRGADANIEGRSVLLATGVKDVRPPFANPKDHDAALAAGLLHYCPVCDGFEVSGKDVVVFGSGAHGVNEALFLRSFTPQVTLVCPSGSHNISPEDSERLREARVLVLDGPVLSLRLEDGGLIFSTGQKVYRSEAVYVAMGCKQQTDLAKGLQVTLSATGAITVDAHQRTSRPRVYAAGDVVQGLDQITSAIGQAAVAAMTIRNDLPVSLAS
jgi:thioredoxin reductase (NADPH)